MTSTDDSTRIPFGAGETDNVPPAWAGHMLTYIKSEHGGVFIEALAYALDLEMPAPRRARRTPAVPPHAAPALTVASGTHAKTS